MQGSRTLLNWGGGIKGDVTGEEEKEVGEPEEKEEKKQVPDTDGKIEITEDTRLQELLERYPKLKEELPKINSKFKMLNTPLARIMIPKATVKIMSERAEMPLDELIKTLKEFVERQ